MLFLLIFIFLLVIAVWAFMQQPQFGKLPDGARLERIKKSPNYKNGSFENLNPTPALTEGVSYFKMFKDFFFSSKKRNKPIDELPSEKTDLLGLDKTKEVLVWFGHASYFLQLGGRTILVDPVFSGAASPLPFTTRAFKGADRYTPDDMPEIDYLFISHDHWDHLDYKTVTALKKKVKTVICPLGVGAHLEYWGFDTAKIIERDWNEEITLADGWKVFTLPARHFSGRGFKRNQSLWTSWALITPNFRIYMGGDSGYDTHFKTIGDKFGSFDLAVLENGQYDANWKYIHMFPNEVLKAAKDLNAKRLLPVHSSKFALANHDWDTPLKTLIAQNEKQGIAVLTPIIGQPVWLADTTQRFSNWWEGVK